MQVQLRLAEPLDSASSRKGLTCFCRVFGTLKSTVMSANVYVDPADDTLVHCGNLPFAGGEQYECGAVLKPDPKMLK